ncbi:helix-turn-helix domain-containing protein [Amycolatopsis sp. NPDC051061]|uniref:winged helix-turn-helix transcriptional regulator n=1 Tax=Amycolatopsis sp. NPDC051061 TaxID=3155042 RepID=UPI00342FBDA6
MASTRETRQQLLYQSVLDLLANKWTLPVICALEGGPERFGELQRNLHGVNPKVLTRTLRRLQEFGIVERVVYPSVPLRVEYSLTELGHSSTGPLQAILSWTENLLADSAAPSRRPRDEQLIS